MMRIRSQRHIVIDIKAEILSKALRRIGLTFISESFRTCAEVAVDDPIIGFFPCRSELAIRIRHDSLEVGQSTVGQFTVSILLRAIVQALHDRLWNDAVVLHHIENIVEGTALSEVQLPMHTYILLAFVLV